MNSEPSFLGRASPLFFFFPESLRQMRPLHKEVRDEKWVMKGRGNGFNSHLPWGCFMYCCTCERTSECTWKKIICSYLPGTARMLSVGHSVNWNSLSFGWDFHCVLLLLGTGSVLMKENFNGTALSSSRRNTRPPLEGEKNVSSLAVREAPYILCQCLLDRKPASHSGQTCSTLSCRICCCHTLQTHSPQAAIPIGIVAT